MHNNLSEKQKQILLYNHGCVVAKACPGSGKTLSVAARIAKLIQDNNFTTKGIAAISFTNVAGDEIRDKLKRQNKDFQSLHYPHFLGTIDKFLNTYIFLPHGHLIMRCKKRPELVGPPHKSWTKGKGDKKYFKGRCVDANPSGYFDMTSFDIDGKLYPLVPAQEFHFSFKNYYNKNKTISKRIKDIIDAKWQNFAEGYANQSDANFISLQILEKYPLIAKTIAKKFSYFIIDEAQDTDAVQMRILDILHQSGATNIMLVGDRDQSIFEWNNADPKLFDAKYQKWDKIDLDENWRSSQRICDFTQPLSTFPRSFASSPVVAKCDSVPTIKGYLPGNIPSMNSILSEFFAACEQNDIRVSKENTAILYRGKSMAEYLGIPINKDHVNSFWVAHNYHVKDIVCGKLLYEMGQFKKGYTLMESGFLEAINKVQDVNYYCSAALIKDYLEKDGINVHRAKIYEYIKLLPPIYNQNLSAWINLANQNFKAAGKSTVLRVNIRNANTPIQSIFSKEMNLKDHFPFYHGTIHSVKGKTFDATLLMLGKKAGAHSNYITMLNNGPKPEEAEELRAVYVGLTRPRKVLYLVVPASDVADWTKKLK